jgi:hypothetical protein
VEVKVGDVPFTPLIDGPVVGYDSKKSMQPGESAITLKVHDDSVYLNREERTERIENKLDHEIASQLFLEIEQIANVETDKTNPSAEGFPPVEIQRGTSMDMLTMLAERQGMHAYVLPGDEPGKSVGNFKKFTTEPSDLPTLILLGPDRNIVSCDITDDAQSPSTVSVSFMSAADKSITTSTSNPQDAELLGDELSFEAEGWDTAARISLPGDGGFVDPDSRVQAEADRDSYSTEATGSVVASCYPGVLQPYKVVTVRGVNEQGSGYYIIKSVTHRLTRSDYSQSFVLRRNSKSERLSAGFNNPAGKIFG